MVNPASSMMKQSTITELVASFDDQTSFNTCNEGRVALLEEVKSAAIVMSMINPTLVPPSCIAA